MALIPALLLLSALSILVLSFLTSGVSGSKVAVQQDDDYRLRSAAESAGNLAAENLWSAYLRDQGGAAGSITSFRNFLAARGIQDGAAPSDYLSHVNLPQAGNLDHERVDALALARRDQGNTTQLYFTVGTSSTRGQGQAHGGTARAVQIVYNVAPDTFDGFDYAILTQNVNCIFCHTKIDNAKRVYNHDSSLFGTFAKVKVGALSSLELRSDRSVSIGDSDADSVIAGTLYTRGQAFDQGGIPISNWNNQSAKSCVFDTDGHIVEDLVGNFSTQNFLPSPNPPQPGENLYLGYPEQYSQMVDGGLPTSFPPPFPDDGGVDPVTGQHTSSGANNKKVDPNEFYAATQTATGTVSGGVIQVVGPNQSISTDASWSTAVTTGNTSSLGGVDANGAPLVTHGNVVITGTDANPILISGTVAIDGDVVLQGVVKGQGVILAKGNLYVPSNLVYADGKAYNPGDQPGSPTGPRTFGVAQDGTLNALGLAAGGNMLIGDYLDPSVFQNHADNAIVDGTPATSWNFTLAEISIFNRNEWSYTQPFLPGQGQNINNPASWTVANPYFKGTDYVPRYYQFGPGDAIPILNKGGLYFDGSTWRGPETALTWDMSKLTVLNPNDTSNPLLYNQSTGAPIASVLQVTPTGGWLGDQVYENAMEAWKNTLTPGSAMKIDGLLYTNNAIFGIVHRSDVMDGQLIVNGSLVCADLGLLSPGKASAGTMGTNANLPGSPFKIGLRLNYDERTKAMLNVQNPNQVSMHRSLMTPAAAPN
ncbi:MAG: hypothetical protein IPJ19_00570 [Planctomycetes bacterium]|nr:hypothetical protein [Planctomycetota bacterium]